MNNSRPISRQSSSSSFIPDDPTPSGSPSSLGAATIRGSVSRPRTTSGSIPNDLRPTGAQSFAIARDLANECFEKIEIIKGKLDTLDDAPSKDFLKSELDRHTATFNECQDRLMRVRIDHRENPAHREINDQLVRLSHHFSNLQDVLPAR